MINLSRLEEIKDLRTVWPHEALDFTPWLAEDDNLALLGDAVGLDITLDETESSVGDFNVDIYATETGTDNKIIIENQLEDTNHDHLGKLITYASGKSANIQARYEYWSAFNEYAFATSRFSKAFNQRKASTDHWMSLSVGVSSCHIDILQIRKDNNIGVEWNIPDDKELYHKLYEHKSEIELEMGIQLDWRELPDKKASRIVILTDADFENKDKWHEQFEWVMDIALKMKKAFKKYI